VRLCRDVAKERLIVTALNAALGWAVGGSSLAPSYWGDGINHHLIKSNLWCLRQRSAPGRQASSALGIKRQIFRFLPLA
jgi:hypothetical protein